MGPFEIVMIALFIAVVVYHFWRDAKKRKHPPKKLTGRRRVLDRIALLVVAMLVIALLPLAAVFGLHACDRFERNKYTQRPFDQDLWLASDPRSDEARFLRWSMHEDAATRIRPGMTEAEVKAILGEPTVEEQGYLEENEALFEYHMPEPGVDVFGGHQVRVSVWFENGTVKRCTTDRPSS